MTKRPAVPITRVKELVAQLEALGADREPLDFMRDLRAGWPAPDVTRGDLDEVVEFLATLLPKPKGRRRGLSGELASRIVALLVEHRIPVETSTAAVVQQFALTPKQAKSLSSLVDSLLRKRDLGPKPKTELDLEIEKARRFHLGGRGEFVPPDDIPRK